MKPRKYSITLSETDINIIKRKIRILHIVYTDRGDESPDLMDCIILSIGKQIFNQYEKPQIECKESKKDEEQQKRKILD